ncbi:Ribose import binding protein RbsB [Ensifer adhaerens]|uniref:ABC transporter substrate-binding protein n=1 Tax=Ensifer adhaerens TaxID=106592 RepID=UPI00156930C6|nr:ABC transporter substrate-binding protein [Ensifer adhaerens]NRP21769.1 Ribose import binding protein RbsB [Ensifer adhaerens]
MEFSSNRIWSRPLVIASVLGLTIASSVASVASAQDVTIPVIVRDITSSYWQTVLAGARKAKTELGINVPEFGVQSESDINGQIALLENAVASGANAVVIAPIEFIALGGAVDQAASALPVVGIDSPANSKAFASFLTTDNEQGGRLAADGLAAAIASANGGKIEGDVALIVANAGSGSDEARARGFRDQLSAKYPALNLYSDKVADGQPTTGLNMTTDLLVAKPDLKGIFVTNLQMSQGAGQSIAENNLQDKVALIGFDSDDKTVGFLSGGVIDGLIVQDPFRMGYDGVKTAYAASKGERVEKDVDTGANLITTANMGEPRHQHLLNPTAE